MGRSDERRPGGHANGQTPPGAQCSPPPCPPTYYSVADGDVADARTTIRGSVADMRSLLADVTHNEPLAEGAFEKTTNERACRRCKFLRLCRPDLLERGAGK